MIEIKEEYKWCKAVENYYNECFKNEPMVASDVSVMKEGDVTYIKIVLKAELTPERLADINKTINWTDDKQTELEV